MANNLKSLDIYLMGIGGTAMGAFAGLLKSCGHRVRGSDSALYSPMKEKLAQWGIECQTPYQAENMAENPDLVVVGNVIRRENVEAQEMFKRGLAHDSFPSALNKLFLPKADSIVASGTHGKTTCSALLAHTIYSAGIDLGFLIGGIPLNFGESFRASAEEKYPFVIEGDEYDTAFFDKRPKFVHYDPNYLLSTSLEFDHGDIYQDLDAIIKVFAELFSSIKNQDYIVINGDDENIALAMKQSGCEAKVLTYGDHGDFRCQNVCFNPQGTTFNVSLKGRDLGQVSTTLFGQHNLKNALGCYAILHCYGLSHEQINAGFKSFLGVKRRLEEIYNKDGLVVIDDFAHHPSAVKETIVAVKQKYPSKKIWAIFEPRSATSCSKIFEERYQNAFLQAHKVMLAPLGRKTASDEGLDTGKIAKNLRKSQVNAIAYADYRDLERDLAEAGNNDVLLFMSNGDFHGLLNKLSCA